MCGQKCICYLEVQVLGSAKMKYAKFVTVIEKVTTLRATIQSEQFHCIDQCLVYLFICLVFWNLYVVRFRLRLITRKTIEKLENA